MLEQSTIITAIVVGGGLIVQAAYLKGVFGTRIDNNKENIEKLIKRAEDADSRLEDGSKTFQYIRENIAEMTGTLRAATTEISRLRDSVVYKGTCDIVSGNLDKRIERVEHKENGNE